MASLISNRPPCHARATGVIARLVAGPWPRPPMTVVALAVAAVAAVAGAPLPPRAAMVAATIATARLPATRRWFTLLVIGAGELGLEPFAARVRLVRDEQPEINADPEGTPRARARGAGAPGAGGEGAQPTARRRHCR